MSLVLVSSTNVWVMIATIIMSLISYRLRCVYVSTGRCLRRIEALGKSAIDMQTLFEKSHEKKFLYSFGIGRSAIISHTNATISGLSTIRATNSKHVLINELNELQNQNTSVCFTFKAATRAIAFWLELICVCYMAIAIAIFLTFQNRNYSANFLCILKLLN